MNRLQKRIVLSLLILTILSPLGLYVPHLLKAGNAWGEWSPETVKQQIGFVPQGMKMTSNLWNAPLSGYSSGISGNTVHRNAFYYVVSGLVGIGIIASISLVGYVVVRKTRN